MYFLAPTVYSTFNPAHDLQLLSHAGPSDQIDDGGALPLQGARPLLE